MTVTDIIKRMSAAGASRTAMQRALRVAGHRVSTGVIRRHVLAARTTGA